MHLVSESISPLSVHRTFVVQFRADTHLDSDWTTGRVEHIASRAITYFNSLEALLAFIHRVIQQHGNVTIDEG